MALALYLDDCAYAMRLAQMLRDVGHTVTIPAEVSLSGHDDDEHFEYARGHGLMLVTKNPRDFRNLHALNVTHPGVIVICQDNDPTRDMSYSEIAAAIEYLEQTYAQSGTSLANAVHTLNEWRVRAPQPPAPPAPSLPPGSPMPPPATKPRGKRRKPSKKSDDETAINDPPPPQ